MSGRMITVDAYFLQLVQTILIEKRLLPANFSERFRWNTGSWYIDQPVRMALVCCAINQYC